MSEMIERVAKAIGAATAGINWEHTDAQLRGYLLEDARAAIEAMREPTEAMVEAGDCTPGGPGFCDEPGDPPETSDIWANMIDAALTETVTSSSPSPQTKAEAPSASGR